MKQNCPAQNVSGVETVKPFKALISYSGLPVSLFVE